MVGCTTQKPSQAATASPDVLQNFERKIADQYLGDVPEIPRIRNAAQSAKFIQSVKNLNEAKLDDRLLSNSQLNAIKMENQSLAKIQFEQTHWLHLNHLSDLYYLQLPDATPTNSELERIKANITLQNRAGVHYPSSLALNANLLIESSLTESAGNPRYVNQWMRRKILPLVNESQLRRFANSFSQPEPPTPESRSHYDHSKYDIRTEKGHRQLILDIVALHVEESATSNMNISVYGSDTHLFDIVKVFHADLLISFEALEVFPAFELQSLSYEIAGQLSSASHWPRPWRRTLALLQGQIRSQYMFNKNAYDSPIARLGYQTRKNLFHTLALIEANLVLELWSLKDAAYHLQQNSPYEPTQIDYLLTQLVAEEGSYAAAAIAFEGLEGHSVTLSELTHIPNDLDGMIEQLSLEVDSEDS